MNYDNMGSSDRKEVRPPAGGSAVPVTPLPLARQSSVYSLTLDEFQNSMGGIGKDFGSMNMDEFLKNIWTAEESQAMASAAVGGGGGDGTIDGLQRQGSLTLPRTLSQKTVDEVWRGLVGGQPDFQQQQQQQQQQRQPTLGEMTLEEFLVRAGVVREDINQQALSNTTATSNNNNGMFYSEFPASNSNSDFSFGFTQPGGNNGSIATSPIPNNGRPYTAPLPLGNNPDLTSLQGLAGGGIMGIADPTLNNGLMPGVAGLGGGGVTVAAVGSPANLSSSDGLMKGNGDLSSLSPVPYVFSGGMRGRKSSGTVEKVVERRQRRMIKNRESAARSRARKQAYTMELEAEVATLKEQNEDLQKKQAEIMEMQKNRVLEMINQQHGPKKQCLRRTQTGPW